MPLLTEGHPENARCCSERSRDDLRERSRQITRLRSLAATTGSPLVRVAAEAGYGRVMLAHGDMTEAESALRRALTGDRALGWLSDEMRDGVALAWGLAEQQQRFAAAREILQSLAAVRIPPLSRAGRPLSI